MAEGTFAPVKPRSLYSTEHHMQRGLLLIGKSVFKASVHAIMESVFAMVAGVYAAMACVYVTMASALATVASIYATIAGVYRQAMIREQHERNNMLDFSKCKWVGCDN